MSPLDSWVADRTTVPLRHLVTCLDGRRIPLNREQRSYRSGVFPYWGANGVVDSVDDFLFDEQLVLLGEDGAPFFDRGKEVAFAVSGKIWANNHIHVLRPNRGQDPRYLAYALNAVDYGPWVDGTTRDKLTQDSMLSIGIPWVDGDWQRRIADYLDAETSRIDGLIERRRSMLAALSERLISEAERRVLGAIASGGQGTQPSAFFGSRPNEWQETTLRHVGVEAQSGPFGSQLHAEEYITGGTPVINPMHLVDGGIRPSDGVSVTEAKVADLSRHVLETGDILVARRGELGRVAVVDQASAGWLCGTGCLRLRLRSAVLRAGYLSILLSSSPLRAYFAIASVGSTMDNLSSETLLAAPVLVPPPDEQAAIEVAVGRARRNATRIAAPMSRQLALLLERRGALITATVTGQLDIPGIAA